MAEKGWKGEEKEDSYVLYRFSDEYSREKSSRDLRFRFEKLINQWFTLLTVFRSKGDILIEKYLKRIVYLDVWEIRINNIQDDENVR